MAQGAPVKAGPAAVVAKVEIRPQGVDALVTQHDGVGEEARCREEDPGYGTQDAVDYVRPRPTAEAFGGGEVGDEDGGAGRTPLHPHGDQRGDQNSMADFRADARPFRVGEDRTCVEAGEFGDLGRGAG